MDSLLSVILTSSATVISGMVLYLLKRYLNRQQRKEEARDAVKAEESALLLRSLKALGKLTVANSIALREGKTNGELTAALRDYEAVDNEMYQYLVNNHARTAS